MYKCLDCGEKFESPKKEEEYRGEYWGTPAYETMYYCPCCGGDFEEAEDDEDEEIF